MAVRDSLRIPLTVLAAALLLLAGCGPLPHPDRPSAAGPRPTFYHIRSGDTLYSIGQRYGVDPAKLQRWNGISDPADLEVGSRIRLRPARIQNGPRVGKVEKDGTAGGSEALSRGPEGWQWPVSGRILKAFSQGNRLNNGIEIAANVGAPVRAAAPGEVVYSGNGLRGYGNLVILRHDGDFITTYAYNRELLVREKERVEAGQVIARVGETGAAEEPSQHFEVRHRTEPVDPLRVLPERSRQ